MAADSKPSNYRFAIAGLTLWAHFAGGLSFQAVSPVLPLITEDYNINHTTAGLLAGVVLMMSGAFGLPGAAIVGKLGVKRVYGISWFMMGAMTLAALSPGFEGLMALRIAYGLGMAAMMPATGPLVMHWFRPKELPVINSLNIAMFTLGMMLSVSMAAPLSDVLGWPRVLGLFGAVGLGGAFAWLLWGRAPDAIEGPGGFVAWREVWTVVKNRTVLILGLADAACFSLYIALTSWLPTFYHESRDVSLTEAGFIIGLLPFMGIFAVALGGFLPLKIGEKRLFFIVPGAMAGLGGLGAVLVDNTAVTYVSVVLVGLGSWLYIPMLLTLPMQLPGMTPSRVAIAWGWIMTASGLAGFVAPLAVGAIRDAFGTFIPGFLIFAGFAWFLFVAGFLLPGTATPRATAAPPAPASPALE